MLTATNTACFVAITCPEDWIADGNHHFTLLSSMWVSPSAELIPAVPLHRKSSPSRGTGLGNWALHPGMVTIKNIPS